MLSSVLKIGESTSLTGRRHVRAVLLYAELRSRFGVQMDQ